jgi:hypothetical protein
MICICSFSRFGKIKGISFNRIYNVKYTCNGKLLIKNDFGKPQLVDPDNFLKYQNIKDFI